MVGQSRIPRWTGRPPIHPQRRQKELDRKLEPTNVSSYFQENLNVYADRSSAEGMSLFGRRKERKTPGK